MPRLTLIGIEGVPPVQPGDEVAELIAKGLAAEPLLDGDVVVVASKIVSKAEGRFVRLADVAPSPRAVELAAVTDKDPRLVELALRESVEVVRAVPGVLLTKHRLGFTSANAGIDRSNVGGADDVVLVLPVDPDASAERIRAALGGKVAVVISDTHGRPFRRGNVGVAIGVAGLPALVDARGTPDLFGRVLEATVIPLADAVAAAAALVTGEAAEGVPAVIVRGLRWDGEPGRASDLVRTPEEDLFGGSR